MPLAPGDSGSAATQPRASAPRPTVARRESPRIGLLLALWTAVGFVYWVQTYYTVSAQSAGYGWRDALEDTWPTWAIWLALAPLIAAVDHRALTSRPLVQRLLGHVLLSLPVTAVYVALSLGLDRLRGSSPSWSENGLYRFQWHLTNYWVLAGLLLLISLHRTVVSQRQEVSELGRRLAEARLQSLSNQVRPHFLFNSLNTVAAVLEREPAQARRLLADLAENLRFVLKRTGEGGDLIPCSEELALVERSVSLEQARLGERLSLVHRIEGDPADLAVPPFSIQTLVENAIRHAVERRAEPTRVELLVKADRRRLFVEVTDDGPGLTCANSTGESPSASGNGIGLDNLRHRLEALFGDRARLSVEPGVGGIGVRASMTLPATKAEVGNGVRGD